MPVLAVDNLTKSYGDLRAVRGVSFHVEAGEIYGLLGPNGAGKTTTISIIATLLQPDSGRVVVDGDRTGPQRDVRWRIGLVPQEVSLAEKLTARECLRFFGRLYDLKGRNLRDRVEQRLADVGLTDRGHDYVKTYSGGMQRRLNIAAALLHDPALLLMDEPTAGVDPQSRAYIFDIIEKLAANGAAVVYTTHYMEEAQRLCRRIGIMDHGRILAEGTLAELVNRVGAKRILHVASDGLDGAQAENLARELGNVPFELSEGQVDLVVTAAGDLLPDAVRAADRLGISIRSIALREPNLETVFLELTGRALRD